MSYKLKHTAEAIDFKLDLIDKNKNLLPYPYITELPAGLEDVGDGSILTSATETTETKISLSTCALPTGKKYIISLDVRDLIDEPIKDHGFELVITGANAVNGIIDLSKDSEVQERSVEASLKIPESFEADWLIKPQIEEASDGQTSPSNWVPYMDTIGTYVDERFNSTNAKVKILTNRLKELTEQVTTLTRQLENITGLSDYSILVVKDAIKDDNNT